MRRDVDSGVNEHTYTPTHKLSAVVEKIQSRLKPPTDGSSPTRRPRFCVRVCVHPQPQHIENKEDLRRVLQKKHEIVAQAKREERESIRDQERAARDIRNMSSSSYGATNGEPRGDPVRRTPSSGTLFAKAHSSGGRYGGVAGGIAGGGRLGGAGDRVAGVLPDQVRKTCVEKSMTDFFHMT